jgi:hypothetical protein
MTNVEQVTPGFHWAEPLNESGFEVDRVGAELVVSGIPPSYSSPAHSTDLIWQYQNSRRHASPDQRGIEVQAPDIAFANADSDAKLIAFVRRFGPVVAKEVTDTRLIANVAFGEPQFPGRLIAIQDLQELRNEQEIFCAAVTITAALGAENFTSASCRHLLEGIAQKIQDWPRQWERQRSSSVLEPQWQLRTSSLKRIIETSAYIERLPESSTLISDRAPCRVVICELLNTFPEYACPNLLAVHSSIRWGIRPLLYMLLRHRFFHYRETETCLNIHCRQFFNLERAGQRFCSARCSTQQRQRDYWRETGKELRTERVKEKRAKKTKR